MKIIEPDAKYLDPKELTPYQFMEKAGRTCYKSEANITDESAVKFVQGLKKSGHTAMLEHAHIILYIKNGTSMPLIDLLIKNDFNNDGTKVRILNYLNISNVLDGFIVSGSFRSFLALYNPEILNDASNELKYLLKKLHAEYPEIFDDVDYPEYQTETIFPPIYFFTRDEFISFAKELQAEGFDSERLIMKHLTHTVLFICDRGVTHEFVRHRPCSFAQESTRYCTYSKDKFGNEITVIRPCFFEEGSEAYEVWKQGCEQDEKTYMRLIELGCAAQQARDSLPTSVKTEIIMTATEEEWQHIINLRYHGTTGSPHPQMVQSMSLIYDTLCEKSEHRLK